MKDWKQINTLLDKINHLHANLTATNGVISRLERDLMLDYLKDLYEAIAEVTPSHSAPVAKNIPVVKEPSLVDRPAVVIAPTPAEPAPVVAPKIEPLPSVTVHIPEPMTPVAPVEPQPAPEIVEMIAPPPIVTPKPAVTPPIPVLQAEPAQASTTPVETKPSANGMSVIFEAQKSTDLSDRLGDAPIQDLNRALGFNEKYLICNQLFGGDFNVFYQTMQQLNQFSQFSQAQQLLSPLAHKHNWAEEEKKEQAQAFIKLVRRRYKSGNS